jgi:putative GTP pyrophosphokinase
LAVDRHSRGDVRRAGETLRKLREQLHGPQQPWTEEDLRAFVDALDIAYWWRESHAKSLKAARMGLVSRTRTALGIEQPDVTQRHKRMTTILDKLEREPGMRLDRMWDIAGCRVVVPTPSDCYAVKERWESRPPQREGLKDRISDYVIAPKPDGYRAIHLYVNYHSRVVEVQIRSQIMHGWAMLSENLDSVTSAGLKRGDAPDEVVRWMSATSSAMAQEEAGNEPDAQTLAELSTLRVTALRALEDWKRRRPHG